MAASAAAPALKAPHVPLWLCAYGCLGAGGLELDSAPAGCVLVQVRELSLGRCNACHWAHLGAVVCQLQQRSYRTVDIVVTLVQHVQYQPSGEAGKKLCKVIA
jgi:hypothetical protein